MLNAPTSCDYHGQKNSVELTFRLNVSSPSAAGADGKVGRQVGGLGPAGRIHPHNYQFRANDSRGAAAVQLALAANDH